MRPLWLLWILVPYSMAFQWESPQELPAEPRNLASWVGAWEAAVSIRPGERLHLVLVIERRKRAYSAELYQFRFPKDGIPLPTQDPVIEGNRMKLVLEGFPAQLNAVLDAETGGMRGHWIWQGEAQPESTWRPLAIREFDRLRYPLGKSPGRKVRLKYTIPRHPEPGLPVKDLAKTSLKWAPLQAVLTRAAQGEWGRIHGVLLADGGSLVLEQYYFGFEKDDLHEIRSVQKGLVALELMKLLELGAIKSLEEPFEHFLNPAQKKVWQASGKSSITLHHLLTMTSGLDALAYGSESVMQSRSGDYVAYMLNAPVTRPAGEAFEYHSGAMNLLVAAAETAGGEPFASLLQKHFWEPMGIQKTHFYYDPSGRFYGAGGGAMRPRDLLKVGLLIAGQGRFAGKQLLEPNLLETMIAVQIPKLPWRERSLSYGYLWFQRAYEFAGKEVLVFQARGAGGQVLAVVPQWDLVWMITAGNYQDLDSMQDSMLAFMEALWQARQK